MKSSLAIFLLLSTASAVNLKFAEGLDGNEELGLDIHMNEGKLAKDTPTNVAAFAQAAARSGSGVRARWVELPDCAGQLGANDIPLKDDLSNAIIATCKSYHPHATPDS